MLKLIKIQKTKISLKQHFLRRNKILVKRRCGGIGDIVMTRMMFQDIAETFPELELCFSCPKPYLKFAENHPYVKTVSFESLQESEFGNVYDISTACRVHEMKYKINNQEHRSDIWAKSCGITLSKHNSFLKTDEIQKEKCKTLFKSINPQNKPLVLFTPFANTNSDFGINKSLTEQQIADIKEKLQDYFVFTINKDHHPIFDELNIYQFNSMSCEQWIALVEISDYVISVDTATFHIAGCLKKPLVGIFSFTNGKVYGKYYQFELVQRHKDNGNWDCGPCYCVSMCPKTKSSPKPCMTELKVDEIMRAFEKLSNQN